MPGDTAPPSPAPPPWSPCRNDVGVGIADQSRASKPVITSSSAAVSRTVLVIGPACDNVPNGLGGYSGIRPYVGLSATVPVNAAGMRTDPPPSVLTDHGPMPRPTPDALPPLDPPAVLAGAPGLAVAPGRGG